MEHPGIRRTRSIQGDGFGHEAPARKRYKVCVGFAGEGYSKRWITVIATSREEAKRLATEEYCSHVVVHEAVLW